jgi:hypothetical protein
MYCPGTCLDGLSELSLGTPEHEPLDGGEWSASRHGHALSPGTGPPVPIGQEAGWAPEPVWTYKPEEKSFASAGDRNPIARIFKSVVKHYTD